MSFAADGLLTVFTVGFVTLTVFTATLRVRLLRGAVGLVAVATVINNECVRLVHYTNKKTPYEVFVIN